MTRPDNFSDQPFRGADHAEHSQSQPGVPNGGISWDTSAPITSVASGRYNWNHGVGSSGMDGSAEDSGHIAGIATPVRRVGAAAAAAQLVPFGDTQRPAEEKPAITPRAGGSEGRVADPDVSGQNTIEPLQSEQANKTTEASGQRNDVSATDEVDARADATLDRIPTVAEEPLGAAIKHVGPLLRQGGAEARQALDEYVDERIAMLSQGADAKPIGYSHGGTDKFIPPESPQILVDLFSKPYYLDDPEAYKAAIPYIQSTYQRLAATGMSEDKAYLSAVLTGANLGQVAYFESYGGNNQARLMVSADIIDETLHSDALSVAEFKGIAACQERAGVAHNTSHIFGVCTTLKTGELLVEQEGGDYHRQKHAFLTVENTAGDQYIFDPTNLHPVRNADGQIVRARMALYKMEPNAQGEYHVQWKGYTIRDGKTECTETKDMVYVFGDRPQ